MEKNKEKDLKNLAKYCIPPDKEHHKVSDPKAVAKNIQNQADKLFSSLLTYDKLPTRSEIIEMLKLNRNISYYPKEINEDLFISIMQSPLTRHIMCDKFGFAIPCSEAIDMIMKYQPILEIGAGSGFWTALLRKQGCDIISTTLEDNCNPYPNKFTEVEQLPAADAIKLYPNRTVFCSWPREWFVELLPQIDNLIFIGELSGCHEEIDFNSFIIKEQYDIPKYSGLRDNLYIMKRINKTKGNNILQT